jgi:nicotinate-nucleotide adenylyltransferase
MKVALFGGTFDPPHNGHIHMMLLLQEMIGFDSIYIIPTNKNLFKETKTPATQRLEMCHKAFDKFSWCKVLDVEMVRGGNSYTIDTVEYLIAQDPYFKAAEKFFLLGQEAAYGLNRWKEADRLVSLAQPIVISQEDFNNALTKGMNDLLSASIQSGWKKATPLGLSSTEIRNRIAQKKYIEHLVPVPIFSYIQDNKLYVKES